MKRIVDTVISGLDLQKYQMKWQDYKNIKRIGEKRSYFAENTLNGEST